MMYIKRIVGIAPLLLLASCSTTTEDAIYNPTFPVNKVQQSNQCYNASIVLNKSITESKHIIKKVTQDLDAAVISDSNDQYVVKRRHHIGLVVGSGGEKITFKLKKIEPQKTDVV